MIPARLGVFLGLMVASQARSEAFEFRHLLNREFPQLEGSHSDRDTPAATLNQRSLWGSYKRWARLVRAAENFELVVRPQSECKTTQENAQAIYARLRDQKKQFENLCMVDVSARKCFSEQLALEGAESALADLAQASHNCLLSESWEGALFESTDKKASFSGLVGLGSHKKENFFLGPHVRLDGASSLGDYTLQSRVQADVGWERSAVTGLVNADARLVGGGDQVEWLVGPRFHWQQGFLKEDRDAHVYFLKAGLQVDVLPIWRHYESNFQYSLDYSNSTDAIYKGLEHTAGYTGPIYIVPGIQGLNYVAALSMYRSLGTALYSRHQAIAVGVEYTSLLSGGGSGSLTVLGEERRDSQGRAHLFPKVIFELKSQPQKLWTWHVASRDWGPESFAAALKIYNQCEADFLSSSVQKIGLAASLDWAWTQFFIKFTGLAERRQYRAAPVADRKDQILALQVEWTYVLGEQFQISVPIGTRIQNVLLRGTVDPALFSFPESAKVTNSFGLNLSYRF